MLRWQDGPLIGIAVLAFSSLFAGRATHGADLAVFCLIAYTVVNGQFSRWRMATWALMLAVWSVAQLLGFALPGGQVGYWAASVATNVLGSLPVVGDRIVAWLFGGFSVDAATRSPFEWLAALPALVILLDWIVAMRARLRGRPRRAWALLAALAVSAALGAALAGLSSAVAPPVPDGAFTPVAIAPPIWFLPQYALLRSAPNKLLGVAIMVAGMLAPALWPAARADRVRRGRYAGLYVAACAAALVNWMALGALGSVPPDDRLIVLVPALAVAHFAFFVGSVPLWRILGARPHGTPNVAVFE